MEVYVEIQYIAIKKHHKCFAWSHCVTSLPNSAVLFIFSHVTCTRPWKAKNSGHSIEVQHRPVNFLPVLSNKYLHHILYQQKKNKDTRTNFGHLQTLKHPLQNFSHYNQRNPCQSSTLAMSTYMNPSLYASARMKA